MSDQVQKILSIPQLWGALLAGFVAILGVRITYPIANPVIGMFDAGIMKAVAIFIMWFIYFFVIWILPWMILFQKKQGGDAGG